MYQLLEREWSTSLFHCDPESCILAHVLPCHIYAKIYDRENINKCYYHILLIIPNLIALTIKEHPAGPAPIIHNLKG